MRCENSAQGVLARGSQGSLGGLFSRRWQGWFLFPSLTYLVINRSLTSLFAERGPFPEPQGDHASSSKTGFFQNLSLGPLYCLPSPAQARNCSILQVFQDKRAGPALSFQDPE